eukprot:m51a1_g1658 hypothetical protein (169) ;mRNA; r:368763-369372
MRVTMANLDELRSTLDGLKRMTPLERKMHALHAMMPGVFGRREAERTAQVVQLERELTASALRLAAKANLLTEILDTAKRLHITQHVREAHELASTLISFGEEMQKGLDEVGLWVASGRKLKEAISIVREASNLPKVDEFLVVLRVRLFDMERGRVVDVRKRSASSPW